MRVVAVGFVMSAERLTTYYRLDTWTKLVGVVEHERQTYIGLTFTEATDVILAHMEQNQPGFFRMEGGVQPTLPLEP